MPCSVHKSLSHVWHLKHTHHLCFGMQVQEICRLVVRRSARVCATLLSAVLHLQEWYDNPTRITIAADGGVILNYPNWRKYHEQYLLEAIGANMEGVCCKCEYIGLVPYKSL
jgi:hexokinase